MGVLMCESMAVFLQVRMSKSLLAIFFEFE